MPMNYPYAADSLEPSLDDPLGLLETVSGGAPGFTKCEHLTSIFLARAW
jgi:hypothetical protein